MSDTETGTNHQPDPILEPQTAANERWDAAAIDRAARAMFDDWVESDWSYTGTSEWDALDDDLHAEWRASAVKVLRAAGDAALFDAFVAGWQSSGEGNNGEYARFDESDEAVVRENLRPRFDRWQGA